MALAAPAAWCQGGLADASLEQLLNTKVTSVSKKQESLAHSAAAVFVINQEDIRRSGASNVPDLLRMVPGVDVAEIDANTWAVSIRGFNERYATKLLVMIDGRSLYKGSFSGVSWDQVNVPLEDIDRIEVIRGPGGSVWGANAVNGVINIITKSSKVTKGASVVAEASSEGDGAGTVRYGGDAGAGGSYRAFGNYSNFAGSILANGNQATDGWTRTHGGFRSDWDLSPSDSVMVQGDMYSNRMSETRFSGFLNLPFDMPFKQEIDASGGDLLARWNHTFAGGSDTSLQAYYDQSRRNDVGQPQMLNMLDIDFQHHFTAGRNEIVWGGGYRSTLLNLPPGYLVNLVPPKRTDPLYAAFFQDEIRLADSLRITVGSRFEHNAYSGFEYEPNIRLAWNPAPNQTVWASASRAVRQPSAVETAVDMQIGSLPLGPNLMETFRLQGNPDFHSEQIRDYEIGYRSQIRPNVSLDVDAFLSFYRRLTTYEPLPVQIIPGPMTVLESTITQANKARAIDYGGEISINWAVNPRWRIIPGYSFLHMNVHLDPTSQDQLAINDDTLVPNNSFQVRSAINLSRRLQWDQSLYWTGGYVNGSLPARARLDSRLAWRASDSLEISIAGQNLLRPDVLEFPNFEEIATAQAPRRILGKITWTF